MTQIVAGKKIAQKILDDLDVRIKRLREQNKEAALAVVIVGDDKPSHTYVKKKGEAAERVGITFFKFDFSSSITKDELILELIKIQAKHKLTGMILQLPVPEHLWPDTREIVNHIDIDIDVDCLSHLANSLIQPQPRWGWLCLDLRQ